MIREAKRLGYHVMTNTTIFKHTEIAEIEELCTFVTQLGVDGLLLSPGYHYESVSEDIFLTRQEIQKSSSACWSSRSGFPICSTPMYLELRGRQARVRLLAVEHRHLHTARLERALLSDRETFTADWDEFWGPRPTGPTEESRKDARLPECAMHSGFEASAVRQLSKSPAT